MIAILRQMVKACISRTGGNTFVSQETGFLIEKKVINDSLEIDEMNEVRVKKGKVLTQHMSMVKTNEKKERAFYRALPFSE